MLKARDVQLEADMQMSMIERDMASWDLLQGFPSLASLSSGQGTVQRNTSGWKQAPPPIPEQTGQARPIVTVLQCNPTELKTVLSLLVSRK